MSSSTITAQQALEEVKLVIEEGDAPYGEDMTTSFKVAGQWFTQRMRQHFQDRKDLEEFGVLAENKNYVSYSLFMERDFVKHGNFIYII
jgi:hypothetical protein